MGRMIQHVDSLDGIQASQLHGFFVDWPNPPTAESHLRLLAGSDSIVLTDGVLSAYIPLLEVLPPYQGQGIGQTLVRQVLAQLGELYMVDLLCDSELESFYARFGMQPACGMIIRNYAHQTGTSRPTV